MKILNLKNIFAFFVMCCLFFGSHSCWSDQIVLSDRVQTTLNVREKPTVESTVVGKLLRNQAVEYLDSVPYWYHVRLGEGGTGYVSKAWSEKLSSEQESGRIVRIGSRNIKKLGHGSQKDYATVAKIIDETFDVMAVVEIMQKGGGHPGYDKLLSVLGPEWNGLVTDAPRPNTGSGSAEFYAILYWPALVKTCSGWDSLAFFPDNDGSGQDLVPDIFSREPAFGCFEVPNTDGTVGFDFLLAGYHARWSQGDKEQIKTEVARLKEVFQAMKESRPSEADLLIAGDFNLVPSEITESLHCVPGTVAEGSTLNSNGAITSNVYDHILCHDLLATQEMIDKPMVLDVTSFTPDGKIFYRKISDHLPVVGQFRAFGPDDD